MKELNSKETKELLEKSIILKKEKKMQLRISFQSILIEMIKRVDNGYNALVGNKAMANEYAEILIKEVYK